MQKLCVTAVGAAFIALGTVGTAPATAALIDFRFTTVSGGTGSFTLDTETAVASEPAVFGPGFTVIAYPNAVSNFSLSAPYVSLESATADWVIAPSFTSDRLGIPDIAGVLSGVVYPAGCSGGTTLGCSVTVGVLYSGNVSELPVLSALPDSYPVVVAVELFEPTTGELLIREPIRQSVRCP